MKKKGKTGPGAEETTAEGMSQIDLSKILFTNRKCPFFPCHDLPEKDWESCLFCFCPLYLTDCPGNPTLLDNSVKDCSNCTFPHKPGAYRKIVEILKTRPPGPCRS